MNNSHITRNAVNLYYPKPVSTEFFDIEYGPNRGSYVATTYDDGSVWMGRLSRNRRKTDWEIEFPTREDYTQWTGREHMRHLE